MNYLLVVQVFVRIPDTVVKINETNRFVESEMKEWMDVVVSTDHDDVAKG